MHCGSLALLLAFAHTHAFTVPMMAAPRFSPSGSRLHMMAAGPEKSAFSLPPAALKLSGPAGSRTGFSCMPSAAAKRVPLRMAPASGYLESLNKGGSGGGGKQSGGGGGGGGGGGDDGTNLPANIVLLLASKNIAARALPKDISAAVIAGRVGATEVAAWADMQNGIFRKIFASLWPGEGFRNRIMANDRFMLVLLLELGIGCVSKMAAEWRERNSRGAFWKELDFVASDMALEIIGDFTLVYLLSGASVTRAPAVAGLGKLIGGLPAHFMATGAFSAAQRAGTLVYKGAMFWMVGLAASLIGHSSTMTLMQARGADTSAMAGVWDNSLQWGNFMGVSSNLRYQLVNGWEARILPMIKVNAAIDTLLTFSVRFGNSYLGGEMWLWWAKKTGLQGDKSQERAQDKKKKKRWGKSKEEPPPPKKSGWFA